MNDPVRHAKYVLGSLPADASEVTEEHVPTITAAVAARGRFHDEIRGRQEKLKKAVDAGDRSPAIAKRLKKVGTQMERLFEAEALLKPWVDRAMEIEMEGETF